MNIEKVFRRYGRPVTAADSSGNVTDRCSCFIQPLRYKNKMYLEGVPTDIGISESGYFLFLAPPSFAIETAADGGYLTDGTDDYHIDRFEKIYIGEKVHFIWAILRTRFPHTYPSYNHFI